ncbi:MAG TPA: DsbA family protein [Patescibacteria group bacterium]|nr:DsbA family protein [Patescibacteria group bacterium]
MKWYFKPKWLVIWLILLGIVVTVSWFTTTVVLYVRQIKNGTFDVAGLSNNQQSLLPGTVPDSQKPQRDTYKVVTQDDPQVGPVQSKVTIVEFGDYECPFSKALAPTFRAVMDQYGDRVLFQYRDFPISDIHDQAQKAAEAAECVKNQNPALYWQYHDLLYQNQDQLNPQVFESFARAVGVDMVSWKNCTESGQMKDEVLKDYQDAISAGVGGTPTVFINGVRIAGVIPKDRLIQVIEELLDVEKKK